MGCGTGLLRMLMFVFNACFWIAGLTIIGVSIWVAVDTENATQDYQDQCIKSCNADATCISNCEANDIPINDIQTLAYMMIALGSLIMIIGFLGCCGAMKNSSCMLWTFFGILFVIFFGLIGCGVAVLIIFGTDVSKSFYALLEDNNALSSSQIIYNCCGRPNSETADTGVDGCSNIYYLSTSTCTCAGAENGNCLDAMVSFFEQYSVGIGIVGLGIGVLMVFGMIVSACLAKSTKDD